MLAGVTREARTKPLGAPKRYGELGSVRPQASESRSYRLCRAHAHRSKRLAVRERAEEGSRCPARDVGEVAEATADHSPAICIDAFPVTEPLDMDHFLGSI